MSIYDSLPAKIDYGFQNTLLGYGAVKFKTYQYDEAERIWLRLLRTAKPGSRMCLKSGIGSLPFTPLRTTSAKPRGY